ncbi:lactate dehydrogenase [Brucella melitensis]|uniref:D-lactate dehydrogenase n=3 Tax=Brucella melitensis TaxID=29459 RepID=C0RML1_BRUMB|nr:MULTISPECIES: lactate dehydrogenase [Brucella]AAL53426.1 d-lactate dehydrogenase [Brucella melitensis bv. 1 str. 16M]ACO02844.1 D-lactate dehydrogenase [Brucella melitensis ATCC 23457]ADZ68300.1 D-lactate dehydrogenase [Brucella melitensis M28]ADZ89165.1 D-lactate dehydrogenase [Brucella melitensis M5-90]AIJ86990.1 D-lactate dehydrogenase, membrane binding family protein [Brucella melitensis bv. 3 str. Ether]AIJ94562.1 D-lactate dehydrogenase, membrane binding family protein [Brucella meli
MTRAAIWPNAFQPHMEIISSAPTKKARRLSSIGLLSVVRYRAVHAKTVEDIVALDIALPRNTLDWFERLPAEIEKKIDVTMYCGHFFCHVLHQEYLVKKGEDCEALKKAILALLEERGAKYPAEHNVGHLYEAEESLKKFYRDLDPTNAFNPGLGQTSYLLNWQTPGYHSDQ